MHSEPSNINPGPRPPPIGDAFGPTLQAAATSGRSTRQQRRAAQMQSPQEPLHQQRADASGPSRAVDGASSVNGQLSGVQPNGAETAPSGMVTPGPNTASLWKQGSGSFASKLRQGLPQVSPSVPLGTSVADPQRPVPPAAQRPPGPQFNHVLLEASLTPLRPQPQPRQMTAGSMTAPSRCEEEGYSAQLDSMSPTVQPPCSPSASACVGRTSTAEPDAASSVAAEDSVSQQDEALEEGPHAALARLGRGSNLSEASLSSWAVQVLAFCSIWQQLHLQTIVTPFLMPRRCMPSTYYLLHWCIISSAMQCGAWEEDELLDPFWEVRWSALKPNLVRKLGGGGYGQVYEAYHCSAPMAVKILTLDDPTRTHCVLDSGANTCFVPPQYRCIFSPHADFAVWSQQLF